MVNKRKRALASILAALLALMLFPVSALAASTDSRNDSIYGGGRYAVHLSTAWAAARFTFTPTVTGWYTFYSDGKTAGDPYFFLTCAYPYTVGDALAAQGYQCETARTYSLAYDDDADGDLNFRSRYFCYAGTTYYLLCTKYRMDQANYFLNVTGPEYGYVTLNRNNGSGGTSGFYTKKENANAGWLYSNSTYTIGAITPPTKANNTFTGYFNTSATSGGTQYVAANGALVNGVGALNNTTLYARWQQNVFILTFNNQGVTNTSSTVGSGSGYPSGVAVPVRTGYTFGGYYSNAGGGTQYYNASGTKVNSPVMNAHNTLYAKWTAKQYDITYSGLDGATIDTNKPATHTYAVATTIPVPTKTEHTFMGWSVNGGAAMTKNLTLGPTAYTANINLKANWVKTTDAKVEDADTLLTSTNLSKENLKDIFDNPVADAAKGVTANELNNSASVHLTLQVSNITGTANGEEEIKAATNGEVVKFFDVKVLKEVTLASGGQAPEIYLTEVPKLIKIEIPLTGDMANKQSYQVLRYHTYVDKNVTFNEIHRLSEDGANGEGMAEGYTVQDDGQSGKKLVIYTRMFSTYAIAAGETSLNLTPVVDGGSGDGRGIDVQGRITQAGIVATYKIDISWGPMVFAYTTASEWDPNNHVYGGASYSWAQKSFEGGNNKITLANHSNADVNIEFAFAKETNQLDGVDVAFKGANSDLAPTQTLYYLSKVPQEGEAAPTAESYLWLSGTPANMPGGTPTSGGESALTKVGVITATVSAAAGTLTPKANTPTAP